MCHEDGKLNFYSNDFFGKFTEKVNYFEDFK
jgi:hypothetical protein